MVQNVFLKFVSGLDINKSPLEGHNNPKQLNDHMNNCRSGSTSNIGRSGGGCGG